MKFPKHIRRRAIEIVRAFKENIITAESWNDNHPDQRPLDCEPDRVALAKTNGLIAAIDAGDKDRASLLAEELEFYLSRVCE